MRVTAIKSFPHGTLGQFEKGKPVEVSDADGEYLVRLGVVIAEPYETKVVREVPAEPAAAPTHKRRKGK